MNGNGDHGVLQRARNLVNEVLRTLPRPLTSEVTDDVLCAIENTPRWRAQFEDLCVEYNLRVVCQKVGLAVSEALNHPEHISRCTKPRNRICRSFTRLRVGKDARRSGE